MIRSFLALSFVLAICKLSIGQIEAGSPIKVNLKLEKKYSLMEPKALYASEMERGEIIIKTDSVKQEFYDVRVVITNMSARPVFIWLMSCGWSANFEINNNYMFFNG